MTGSIQSPQLISHITLRKLLGTLGVLMPFILVFGVFFLKTLFNIPGHADDQILQPSISHYYYTAMGDVFVAILASFGLFLFTYRGYTSENPMKRDNLFTTAAGVCAIVVALFPATPVVSDHSVSGTIHLIAAAAFFVILAYISYFLFTLSDKTPKSMGDRKQSRNLIYRGCALVMLACLLILGYCFIADPQDWPPNTVFIFETIALWAFGISWLTKGEAIMGDK